MFDQREEENPFGDFGTKQKKSPLKLVLRILKWVIFVLVLPFALYGWKDGYQNFLEREEPTISIVNPISGIGVKSQKLSLKIEDNLSGLSDVVVRLHQDERTKEFYRKKLERKDKGLEVELEFNGIDGDFQPGRLEIEIVAVDHSIFKNISKLKLDVLVDLVFPEIETEVIVGEGKSALKSGDVFVPIFKVVEDNLKHVKVLSALKGKSYQAFPLTIFKNEVDPSKIITDFKNSRSFEFFSIVPIELDQSALDNEFVIVATDFSGNVTRSSFSINYKPISPEIREVELPDSYIKANISPIVRQFEEIIRSLGDDSKYLKYLKELQDSNYNNLGQFVFINEHFRNYTEEKLQFFLSKSKEKKFFRGAFDAFIGTKSIIPFGEKVVFSYQGKNAGQYSRSGIFVTANGKSAPVVAANSGQIVFADDLGLYGKTVIVDHGFGLFSLYSSLSEILKREGYVIAKGEKLGKMGKSGLSSEVGFLYEMRIGSTLIDPFKFMDTKWVFSNIESLSSN